MFVPCPYDDIIRAWLVLSDTQVSFLITRFTVTLKKAKAMHFSFYGVASLSVATLCLVGSPVAGETFARLDVAPDGETAQDY